MTVIERAARALCVQRGNNPDALEPGNCPYGDDTEIIDDTEYYGGAAFFRWRLYVPGARAVLQAIREPSEGMLEAADAADEAADPDDNGYGADGKTHWQAMIDAALGEDIGA